VTSASRWCAPPHPFMANTLPDKYQRLESDLSMKTKTHFAFRLDIWDAAANSIVEHVAGVDDFEVAEATYRAAVARWPAARITLRQGARIVHESGQ
jgi:hypothetical protein